MLAAAAQVGQALDIVRNRRQRAVRLRLVVLPASSQLPGAFLSCAVETQVGMLNPAQPVAHEQGANATHPKYVLHRRRMGEGFTYSGGVLEIGDATARAISCLNSGEAVEPVRSVHPMQQCRNEHAVRTAGTAHLRSTRERQVSAGLSSVRCHLFDFSTFTCSCRHQCVARGHRGCVMKHPVEGGRMRARRYFRARDCKSAGFCRTWSTRPSCAAGSHDTTGI